MAYTVKRYKFKDGKVMFEDRIAYANGEYVSFDDYEIAMQKEREEIEGLRKELRESKGHITQLKHELEEKRSFETDRLVKLPFDALETANMLINATYSRKTSNVEKVFIGCNVAKGDIYSIDDLEQIAEHLLVYCKHNKENC